MRVCKSTILGTSVLVVVEDSETVVAEEVRASVAAALAHRDYGTGSDVVVFLSRFNVASRVRVGAQAEFRMNEHIVSLLNEHSLAEAYLLRAFAGPGQPLIASTTAAFAAADYLHREFGSREIWFVSTHPGYMPELHYVYRDLNAPLYSMTTGEPRHLPEEFTTALYGRIAEPLFDAHSVDVLRPLAIGLEEKWLDEIYITYINGPQLVCFPDEIFDQVDEVQDPLLRRLVDYFNGASDVLSSLASGGVALTLPPPIFNPEEGINVTFARVNAEATKGEAAIEGRFFHRRTGQEVRLAGSSAAATVAVAHHTRRISRASAEVNGWRNVTEGRHQSVSVRRNNETWWLEAPVDLIWCGDVRYPTKEPT